ncbi:MAG: hypothetical protein EZS28_036753 [Streblomastix strix]|uniref:Uncharacterized protein n=1 Tax=Streblomastix strix TaxID=222440 RepID=A0A5J4UCT7_9EUKA|nr:MAG: hypothetical protein EZS28_036753 [Streblomastix strix]
METAVQGPVQYTSQVPSLEDVQVDGDTFTHTKQNTNRATILFDPPINKGVVRFEVLSVRDLAQVGIANESVRYSRKEPSEAHGYDEVVIYNWTGGLSHLGDRIENDEFKSGDRVALEVFMNRNTFFIKI